MTEATRDTTKAVTAEATKDITKVAKEAMAAGAMIKDTRVGKAAKVDTPREATTVDVPSVGISSSNQIPIAADV
jgi:hypothetical protein